MRKIKFRAYDKELDMMVTSDSNFESLEDVYREKVSGDWGSYRYEMDEWYPCSVMGELFNCIESVSTDKNVILMQYTGLKDKNGVEVCEGDILQYDAPKKYGHLRECFEVFYNDGRFTWNNNDYLLCERNLGYKYGYVIVGNIYENPDLLEV